MSSTTPNSPSHRRSHSRSQSRTNTTTPPPPRPSTPLRPPSRSSLHLSHTPTGRGQVSDHAPLETLEPAFAEFADNMADLEANLMHVQLMHESLARFNECFASFLHGMKVNAFCVDFPEAPMPESFRRARDNPKFAQGLYNEGEGTGFSRTIGEDSGVDADQTFLTTDTSFVENPPTSSVKPNKFATPAPPRAQASGGGAGGRIGARGRGAPASGVPRGAPGRGRPSGLARASARGRGGSIR